MKPWYGSKIIGLAVLELLTTITSGVTEGWDWKHWLLAAIGVATIVARKYYTDTALQ